MLINNTFIRTKLRDLDQVPRVQSRVERVFASMIEDQKFHTCRPFAVVWISVKVDTLLYCSFHSGRVFMTHQAESSPQWPELKSSPSLRVIPSPLPSFLSFYCLCWLKQKCKKKKHVELSSCSLVRVRQISPDWFNLMSFFGERMKTKRGNMSLVIQRLSSLLSRLLCPDLLMLGSRWLSQHWHTLTRYRCYF